MRQAFAITHVPFEDLDAMAAPVKARGYSLTYVDATRLGDHASQLAAADLLFVLGGPIGAYDVADFPFLNEEIALLRERLDAKRATCGICLGGQLMAAALGAKVYPGAQGKELGWGPIALTDAGRASPLRHLRDRPVLHWHGDTFDLPSGATLLASTAKYPNQACSWGNYGLALQFHCEVTARGLERWYVGHAAEIGTAGVSIPSLRAQSASYASDSACAGTALLDEWLHSIA